MQDAARLPIGQLGPCSVRRAEDARASAQSSHVMLGMIDEYRYLVRHVLERKIISDVMCFTLRQSRSSGASAWPR